MSLQFIFSNVKRPYQGQIPRYLNIQNINVYCEWSPLSTNVHIVLVAGF